MSKEVCRTGDEVQGTCYNHSHPRSYTGTWDQGSGNVTSNGLSMIRENDTGTADCGHTFVAVGGSSGVDANGLKLQRVGDPVTGSNIDGFSITGSSNVTST